MTPAHLVEMRDTTGGVVLTCHGCTTFRCELIASEQPLDLDTYAQVRTEAMAIRDMHQYPACQFGVVAYREIT